MTIEDFKSKNVVCWKSPKRRPEAPKSDIPDWRDSEQGRTPEKPRVRLWGALTPEAQGCVIFFGAALMVGAIVSWSIHQGLDCNPSLFLRLF
jgi:hypothetical protein